SAVGYHITLQQFMQALAPHDWNHDGVKDLVTPSQYVPAYGATQSVIATAKQRFQILDGKSGETLSTVTTRYPVGMVVSCGNDAFLNVITGHARRLEALRIDPFTGNATSDT